MNLNAPAAGFHPVRRDQLREDDEHDSYRLRQKPPEPSACSGCGAVFHAGRWQWGQPPRNAVEVICPACQRIHDHFPAGFVHIGGEFFAAHREELLSLIRHHAEKARSEHPLARLIDICDEDTHGDDVQGMLITTTDIHLARDLGEALHHAYHGELAFHYNEAENLLRVHWRR